MLITKQAKQLLASPRMTREAAGYEFRPHSLTLWGTLLHICGGCGAKQIEESENSGCGPCGRFCTTTNMTAANYCCCCNTESLLNWSAVVFDSAGPLLF
jgi:hypothetical protein